MKFVTIRDFRAKSGQIQRELPLEREMVLTSNGKPVAIISSVTERDVIETLSAIRTARAALAVEMLQRGSIKQGKNALTASDINSEISRARHKRVGA